MPQIVIPPNMVKPLGNKIGDQFTFKELDAILFDCSDDHIINEIANETWPMRKTGYYCLEAVEKDGTLEPFLRLIFASQNSDKELRDLILRVAPDLASAGPKIEAKVKLVVGGLDETHAKMHDPNIRAAVASSRETIRAVGKTVEILEVYKNLHDSLHQLQVRRFSELRTAAKEMTTNLAQIDKLRDFQDLMLRAHLLATPWPPKLAHDAMAQAIEQGWVDKIGSAVEKLRTAVDQRQQTEACTALNVVLRIIETHPSRINTLIFAAAKTLPLKGLVAALEQVSAAAGDQAASLKQAAESLAEIRSELLMRVVEHNLWQEVDDGLWVIDRHFIMPPLDAIQDFGIDWPPTKSRVWALADFQAGANWAKNIIQYSDRIDDEILRLEGETARPDSALNIQAVADNLHRIYSDFRQAARFRFLQVDQVLKSECEALVAIGAPLQALLRELENDD